MASLSLKHIYKVYDGTTKAVNDFNMEIRDKEFIVFVGPSGCGKSTTLRMIAGLEDISAGELRIDGVTVNDMEPRDRNIAMVFQNYALYPHMTVYENMAFSLRTAHVPRDEIHRKVTEAAHILGITEYLERKPRALSGGQRQRVALGRAIVRNPKVFLLDEPLSNLDAKLRAAMRAEIIRLYERLGTTFIYVTHDQVEAMTMGSRIVVMRGGFVQQIDTPKNLYNHPANLFVAGFIGTPRMNFWDATLRAEAASGTPKSSPAIDRVTVTLAGGTAFSVPYRALDRVQRRYMDGSHPVIVGVRPDDVRLWSEELDSTAWAKLTCTVSVVEALGGETLIYGYLTGAGDTDTPADPAREIILKASADFDVHRGETVTAAVDLRRLHVFDRESEASLKPRIPTENICPCAVSGGVLSFSGQRFPLPPALRGASGEKQKSPLEGELLLPASAIRLGAGPGSARLEETELVTDTRGSHRLHRLTVGGYTLFAIEPTDTSDTSAVAQSTGRFAPGDSLPFDLDYTRITVESAGIHPLPEENRLDARMVKERDPAAGRRAYRFFLEIGDHRLNADTALCEKLFSGKGTAIFHTPLALRFSPDSVKAVPVTETRPDGSYLSGRVVAVLDYGHATYARIALNKATESPADTPTEVIAPYAGTVGDAVRLIPDQSRMTVVDTAADIIIV